MESTLAKGLFHVHVEAEKLQRPPDKIEIRFRTNQVVAKSDNRPVRIGQLLHPFQDAPEDQCLEFESVTVPHAAPLFKCDLLPIKGGKIDTSEVKKLRPPFG
jgi:hypothetical protein